MRGFSSNCAQKVFIGLWVAATLLVKSPAQESLSHLSHAWTIPLYPVEGRIDHLAADVRGQRLFVAALENNTMEVVDLLEGKFIKSVPGFSEPQGIVYVPEFDRLFVANGQGGTCCILDGHSFQTISTVQLGDDADNVRYDEKAKKVYVGYGNAALAVIDAKTGARGPDIKLAGHPESFQLASAGPEIFVNVPSAGHIAVVDREKGMVTATWPLTETKANFPLSIDETRHRVFVGCRNPPAVLVFDAGTGRQMASVAIAGDTDDLFYDAKNQLIYVSCGAGVVDVIRQTDADHYEKIEGNSTSPGARTSLFIPELKVFCLAIPHRGSQKAEIRIYRSR